jgi:hypothetical protein
LPPTSTEILSRNKKEARRDAKPPDRRLTAVMRDVSQYGLAAIALGANGAARSVQI